MPYVDVLSQEIALDELEPLTCGAIFSITRSTWTGHQMSFMANASKVNLIRRKTLASNFVYPRRYFFLEVITE